MELLIKSWFDLWASGDYLNLPISDNFKHTSPFGTIHGKVAYLDLIRENEAKFLGYTFEVVDTLFEKDRACVRYIARQGDDFHLEVSEWYYPEGDLIGEIVAYYHIGDIKEDRKLEGLDS